MFSLPFTLIIFIRNINLLFSINGQLRSWLFFEGKFTLKLTIFGKVIQYPECRGIRSEGVSYTQKKMRLANLTDLEWELVWRGSTVIIGLKENKVTRSYL